MVGGTPESQTDLCTLEYVECLRTTMQETFIYANKQLEVPAKSQKQTYDRNLKPREFEKGTWVWRWYPPKAGQKLELVSWFVWKAQRREKERIVNGEATTTTVSMTVKEPDFGSLRILSEELQKDIQRATRHIFNIRHQYQSLRLLKDQMTDEEMIIHIDFSENFKCKYSTEIQSMHFGASQRQISLHTGVAYAPAKTFSFCTISDCLKHSPAAIWAHLHPVLSNLKKETGARRVHFVSDGPTTQYRNKQNFYLFCLKIYQYGFEGGTWNFLEAAHGKGAANGIGAAVKRLADKSVIVTGKDVMSASDIQDLASETKVSLYTIPEEDIYSLETEIPPNLKPVPRTMQIHQLVTKTPGIVQHRVLSCFCGGQHLTCTCFTPSTSVFNEEESVDGMTVPTPRITIPTPGKTDSTSGMTDSTSGMTDSTPSPVDSPPGSVIDEQASSNTVEETLGTASADPIEDQPKLVKVSVVEKTLSPDIAWSLMTTFHFPAK